MRVFFAPTLAKLDNTHTMLLASKSADASKPEPAKKSPEEETRTFHDEPRQWLNEHLAKTDLPGQVREDIERVQALILSREEMVKHLHPLDVAINAKRQEGFKVHKAMTSHLAAAEQEAGFKLGMMPVDVLPGPVFEQLIKSGFAPPKDPGAGPAHGESTHRLQWHAIINAHKAGHLKTSPKDLYAHISSVPGLWGGLLDAQGSEGSVIKQGFRRPDDATAFLRSAEGKRLLPNVSEAVDTRYQKRMRELDAAAALGASVAATMARAKASYIAKKTTGQPGSWLPWRWTYAKPAGYERIGHPMLLHRKGGSTMTAEDRDAIEEAGRRTTEGAKAKEPEASDK